MRMFIFTILDCCLVEAVNFPARLYLGLSHQVGAANRLSQRSGRAAGGLSAQLLSRRGISLLPVPKTDSGQARQADQLQFFGKYASLANARTFAAYLAPLRNSKGVVYAKRPFGGPQEVLRYLARYTHRVAISNSRLVSVDKNGVAFKWKDYRIEGPERYKQMPLDTHDACAAAHAVDPAAPAQLRQRRAASSRHPQWLVGRNRALQQRHQALVAIGEMLAHPLRVLERIIVGNNFNATLDHFLGDRMPFKFREQMAHVRHREQRTIIERRPNLIPTQAQQRKQPKWIIRLAIVSAGSAQYVVIDIEGGNQISPVPRPLKSRYGLFGRRNGRIKRRFVIGIEY